MAFDPDTYLSDSSAQAIATPATEPSGGFDPDGYLAGFDPDEYLQSAEPTADRMTLGEKAGITGTVSAKKAGRVFADLTSGIANVPAVAGRAVATAFGQGPREEHTPEKKALIQRGTELAKEYGITADDMDVAGNTYSLNLKRIRERGGTVPPPRDLMAITTAMRQQKETTQPPTAGEVFKTAEQTRGSLEQTMREATTVTPEEEAELKKAGFGFELASDAAGLVAAIPVLMVSGGKGTGVVKGIVSKVPPEMRAKFVQGAVSLARKKFNTAAAKWLEEQAGQFLGFTAQGGLSGAAEGTEGVATGAAQGGKTAAEFALGTGAGGMLASKVKGGVAKAVTQMASGGATFGGVAAFEGGTPREIAKQTILGTGLSATGVAVKRFREKQVAKLAEEEATAERLYQAYRSQTQKMETQPSPTQKMETQRGRLSKPKEQIKEAGRQRQAAKIVEKAKGILGPTLADETVAVRTSTGKPEPRYPSPGNDFQMVAESHREIMRKLGVRNVAELQALDDAELGTRLERLNDKEMLFLDEMPTRELENLHDIFFPERKSFRPPETGLESTGRPTPPGAQPPTQAPVSTAGAQPGQAGKHPAPPAGVPEEIFNRGLALDNRISEVKDAEKREELRVDALDEHMGHLGVTNFKDTNRAMKQLEGASIPFAYMRADGRNLGGANKQAGHAGADAAIREVWGDTFARMCQERGGIVFRNIGGDEMKILWPNKTADQVRQLMPEIDATVDAKAAEMGFGETPGVKDNFKGAPTGAMNVDWGVADYSKGKYGEMDRAADKEAERNKEERKVAFLAKNGYTWDEETNAYVYRGLPETAGVAKQPGVPQVPGVPGTPMAPGTKPTAEAGKPTEAGAQAGEVAAKTPTPTATTAPSATTTATQPAAGELQYGATLPAKVPGANIEKVLNEHLDRASAGEEPYDVKKLMVTVTDRYAPVVEAARRGKVSWKQTDAEVKELAQTMGLSARTLALRATGEAYNAAQLKLAGDIMVTSAARTARKLAEIVKRPSGGGTPEDIAEWRRAMAEHALVQAQFGGARAESGRALNILRRVNQELKVRNADALMELFGDAETNKAIMQRVAELDPNDILGLSKIARDVTKATTADKIFEVWLNAILSHPATQAANIIGNTVTYGYRIGAEKLATVAVEAVRKGSKRQVYFREVPVEAYASLRALPEALRIATEVFQHPERARIREANPPGAIGGTKGKVIRTPTRLLGAADAFFKTATHRAYIHTMAYRMARNEGLKGDARIQRMAEIETNPSDLLMKSADKEAELRTFTSALGPIMRSVLSMRKKTPGLKYVIPFITTPTNIAKFAIERTPPALVAKIARIAKKEVKEEDISEELAKPILGSAIMAGVAALAGQGFITGGGPTDRNKRYALYQTGWRPYSLKIGNRYISYARLEPLGSIVGMAADFGSLRGTTKDAGDVAERLSYSLSKNLTSKTFMQGVSNMIDAIHDPERYGEKWVNQMAGSVVPNIVAGAARASDKELKQVDDLRDVYFSRTPGLTQFVKPKRDLWGTPIEREGNFLSLMFSPVQIGAAKDDPIDKEIVRLDANLSMPRSAFSVTDKVRQEYSVPEDVEEIPLSPKEYDQYSEYAGKKAREYVRAKMITSEYRMADNDSKISMIRSALNKAREEVRGAMVPSVVSRYKRDKDKSTADQMLSYIKGE